MNIKKKWNELDTKFKVDITKLIISVVYSLLLIIAAISIYSLVSSKTEKVSKVDLIETTTNIDGTYPALEIKLIEEDRHLENIYTYRFELINKETGEKSKLSDGILNMDELSNTIENFLNSHPYKICSVGFVDDKFYVQQDTDETRDYNVSVNIVSLSNTFSSEDWLSLTEATYKNAEVEADNIFTYTGAMQSKHYIYIYKQNNTDTNPLNTIENS